MQIIDGEWVDSQLTGALSIIELEDRLEMAAVPLGGTPESSCASCCLFGCVCVEVN